VSIIGAYTTSVSTFANAMLRYSFTANQKHNAKVLVQLIDFLTSEHFTYAYIIKNTEICEQYKNKLCRFTYLENAARQV
jgi:hypothetical protein